MEDIKTAKKKITEKLLPNAISYICRYLDRFGSRYEKLAKEVESKRDRYEEIMKKIKSSEDLDSDDEKLKERFEKISPFVVEFETTVFSLYEQWLMYGTRYRLIG